jgi:hypothetical protein
MNPHIKLSELIDFLTKLLNTHGDNYIFIMLSILKDNSYDK